MSTNQAALSERIQVLEDTIRLIEETVDAENPLTKEQAERIAAGRARLERLQQAPDE